jgi:hypothetical protein
MSFLNDAFKFEQFAVSDIWNSIKKDPERMLYGAIGPWDTKLVNKVWGKDYEPLIDQMGGPYGGHTISAFGNKDGGVYARAEAEGVDTGEAGTLHDAAHVIAAMGAAGASSGASAAGGGAGTTGASSGMAGDWQTYAKLANAALNKQGQGTPSSLYGAPKEQQSGSFRDTFMEQQNDKRRKGLARALVLRGK